MYLYSYTCSAREYSYPDMVDINTLLFSQSSCSDNS